ncbi:hypothetical protein GCM10009854_17390 [Saccharopolyspora halophila]|uniref:DUF397 domain-containing protein n=2 Tax=Saccharopolyspora halophila TaxID=405551 RepID=A0ABN3G0C5_9PSEU
MVIMAPTSPVSGWRKSSFSQGAENCVEVGRSAEGAAVRDTKDRAAGFIAVDGEQWGAFVGAIKNGRFEH